VTRYFSVSSDSSLSDHLLAVEGEDDL